MMLADDCSISEDDAAAIRAEADRLLREAGAVGVFPTPVDEIMRAANIKVVPIALDEGYIAQLRRKAAQAGRALLSALSKVWGVFDPKDRVAFIDPETPKEKLPFLKLHEGGHAVLPWQSIFGIFEDCRKTLDFETKQTFERQANVFASEMLFQRERFTLDARDSAFGLSAALRLATRYGASIYSSLRRYVTEAEGACVLIVLNPIVLCEPHGFSCSLRRVISSPAFERQFRRQVWPDAITPDASLGHMVPLTKRMTGARKVKLTDDNGARRPFIAEAFKTPHQVFILLHLNEPVPVKRLIRPGDHF